MFQEHPFINVQYLLLVYTTYVDHKNVKMHLYRKLIRRRCSLKDPSVGPLYFCVYVLISWFCASVMDSATAAVVCFTDGDHHCLIEHGLWVASTAYKALTGNRTWTSCLPALFIVFHWRLCFILDTQLNRILKICLLNNLPNISDCGKYLSL